MPNSNDDKLALFNTDAFSDGQIRSKLWLCQNLERYLPGDQDYRIAVLAGWYCSIGLSLQLRDKLAIETLTNFDKDERACELSYVINDSLKCQNKFQAVCKDLKDLEPLTEYNLILNTSCEHFSKETWWHVVPSQTYLALQSNNMAHEQHTNRVSSLEDFKKEYENDLNIIYSGLLEFRYDNFEFDRYLIIGKSL